MHNGSCLCGAVTFEIKGELKAPDACHCSQCRKQSGHYWASTNVPRNALALKGADKLTWYQSSEKVRRGFCSVCGAALFWDPAGHDFIAIGMGAFHQPTGAQLEKHIFVADKGDYYQITDGLPQKERY
ncbi:MAG TPA: GFA family protein [Rhizomicrobium sp.]|nr:GFA family protein [Rhizomicrobium sp.]